MAHRLPLLAQRPSIHLGLAQPLSLKHRLAEWSGWPSPSQERGQHTAKVTWMNTNGIRIQVEVESSNVDQQVECLHEALGSNPLVGETQLKPKLTLVIHTPRFQTYPNYTLTH